MLLRTDGAIFDHFFRYFRSPQDLYFVFERGFTVCPSIDVLDAPGSKYHRWRRGKDKYYIKKDWKVVTSLRDKEDQGRFLGAIVRARYVESAIA